MMVFRAQGRLRVSKGPLLGHEVQGWATIVGRTLTFTDRVTLFW